MQASWSSWTFVTVKPGQEPGFSEYNIITLVITTGSLMWCRLAMLFGKARKPTRRRMLSLQRSSCHYLPLEVFFFSSTYSYTSSLFYFFFCTQIRHLFILFDLSYTNVLVSSIERYLNMENYQFARVCKDRKEDCNIDQYPLVKITGQQCLQSPLTLRAMH